jgi:hypothetical protein
LNTFGPSAISSSAARAISVAWQCQTSLNGSSSGEPKALANIGEGMRRAIASCKKYASAWVD